MQRYIDTDLISISGVSGMCWMDGDLCQGAGCASPPTVQSRVKAKQ